MAAFNPFDCFSEKLRRRLITWGRTSSWLR